MEIVLDDFQFVKHRRLLLLFLVTFLIILHVIFLDVCHHVMHAILYAYLWHIHVLYLRARRPVPRRPRRPCLLVEIASLNLVKPVMTETQQATMDAAQVAFVKSLQRPLRTLQVHPAFSVEWLM